MCTHALVSNAAFTEMRAHFISPGAYARGEMTKREEKGSGQSKATQSTINSIAKLVYPCYT